MPVRDYGTASGPSIRATGHDKARNKCSALSRSRRNGGRRLGTATSAAVFEMTGRDALRLLRASGWSCRPSCHPADPKLPRNPLKGRRNVRLDLTCRDLADPIIPRLEPRAFAGPGLHRLSTFLFGHKVDHGAQRERHDVDNMRP